MSQIKRMLKIVIPAVVIICMLVFVPWGFLSAWVSPASDTIQEQVNAALDYNLDGIIVYIDKGGEPPTSYVAGWKDKNTKVPADPHALFKIASISKLYVAVAATKLVHTQQLSLDDTLLELLPSLDARIKHADEITLRMLLQHRSGIPDWIEDPEFPWDTSLTDVNTILELVLDEEALFEPDARYDYSNTNYLLIGNIIDKTVGYGHQQYIKNKILDPLGLENTYGYLSDVDPSDVVSGYDTHYEEDVKMLDFIAASGSMVATAEDVGKFLRALNDGSLLSEEEQEIYSEVYEYGHTGLLPGYQSIARYHEDIDAVLIQFVNTSGGNSSMMSEIVYNKILSILKSQ